LKEVVLTAGSFETPKILMLSGIGDHEELSQHDIETIQHLHDIGKSMKDHAAIFLTALMKPGLYSNIAFENNTEAVQIATDQWAKDGTRNFTEHNMSFAVMFNKIPSLYQTPEFKQLSAAEQEYLLEIRVPTYEITFGGPKFPPSVEVPAGHEYLGITVFGSADPGDRATVDPRAFAHPFDGGVMFDSLTDTLTFFKHRYLQKLFYQLACRARVIRG